MWALLRVCWRGNAASWVEWTRMSGEPDALRSDVGVGARAKMSVGWTWSRLWTVRYCFDMLTRGTTRNECGVCGW